MLGLNKTIPMRYSKLNFADRSAIRAGELLACSDWLGLVAFTRKTAAGAHA